MPYPPQHAVDDAQFNEHDSDLTTTDPLSFRDKKGYLDRITEMTELTGLNDALISAPDYSADGL